MKFTNIFDTESAMTEYLSSADLDTYVFYVIETDRIVYSEKKPIPYNEQYLTLDILSSGTMVWVARFENYYKTLSYSLDNGENWTSITSSTAGTLFNVSAGDKVLLKGTETTYGENSFSASTAYFNIEGNIMSLTNGDDFTSATSLNNYAFYNMFAYTNVVSSENLILPATTLAEGCYQGLFMGCTKLISIPEMPATTLANSCYAYMFDGCTSLASVSLILPATTLASNCYFNMFENCTSLTVAPELPATTLASNCYYNMFKGCTSLTTAPELSATTLADSCYFQMFSGCTSLTTAPVLSATTLANYCYSFMFRGCTSLTTAPDLPATTLEQGCYNSMFNGCTSLNYIKCLANDISANNCTLNWTKGVSATGIFVKAASMSSWSHSVDGIPNGWTVQNDDGSQYIDNDDPIGGDEAD